MITFPDEHLLALNKRGLIPGPMETAMSFGQRIEAIKKKAPPSENSLPIPPKVLDETARLWDIRPDWVEVITSNKKLMPWHGGVSLITEETGKPPTVVIQLREVFRKQETYLKIYHRNEMLVHELAHAARIAFHEPRFEEALAYAASPSSLRKRLGIVSASPWLWLGALVLPIGLPTMWALASKRHRELKRALANLTAITRNPDKALHIAFRLTDREIMSFAKAQAKVICSYAVKRSANDLRWRQITLAYLNDL